jgi:phosphoribosylanthranilate isomerase
VRSEAEPRNEFVWVARMAGRVLIKICGVTNAPDASRAAELGADLVGLNFYERSPRHVDEPRAREILSALPAEVVACGVFANETDDSMHRRLEVEPRLRVAQWHGDGQPPVVKRLALVPAFGIRDQKSLADIRRYLHLCEERNAMPAAILIEGDTGSRYGGTGRLAPWALLADFEVPVPLILAGGLTPENVAEAIRIVRPDIVDTASGVESSPGQKDAGKMERFVAQVREMSERFETRQRLKQWPSISIHHRNN